MSNYSVEYFSEILKATHQEGNGPTQWSIVYDLNECLIYLYHLHQYNNVIIFNLFDELELGEHVYSIPSLFEPSDNIPPSKPIIEGPPSGKINIEHNYSFVSTDADGDEISYYIEWGDGTNSGWTRTLPSGELLNASHIWEQRDSYTIRAKAKDENGAESDWATLEVSMPKSKPIFKWFNWFLEQYPLLEKLLFSLPFYPPQKPMGLFF